MGAPCFNEGVVAALLEGTLDGPRSSEAKRHMLECEPCRRLAEKAGVALGEEVETEAHPVATVPEESHERALTTKGDPGELPAGHTLGRYVVAKRIGRGGMGVVYLAFDNDLERRVALKVLRPEGTFGSDTGELRTRMLREAQAMAKVSHPNVVAVYDVGSFGEQIFVAMEMSAGDATGVEPDASCHEGDPLSLPSGRARAGGRASSGDLAPRLQARKRAR